MILIALKRFTWTPQDVTVFFLGLQRLRDLIKQTRHKTAERKELIFLLMIFLSAKIMQSKQEKILCVFQSITLMPKINFYSTFSYLENSLKCQ